MSLYTEFQVTANCYQPQDDGTTKITTWNKSSPDFQIRITLIRPTSEDTLVFDEQLGTYKANVNDPNASLIKKGTVIVLPDNEAFQVVNKPKVLRLFNNRVKLMLAPV